MSLGDGSMHPQVQQLWMHVPTCTVYPTITEQVALKNQVFSEEYFTKHTILIIIYKDD